jgi:predicted permease
MMTIWQDIRYGIRMLLKSPGFTAIALITLAIGIGANTIMFSLVNVMLLRPVQVKESDRLVGWEARDAFFSYDMYLSVRDDVLPFSKIMAHACDLQPVTVVRGTVAKQVTSTFVSANYFSCLGVRPAQGREFLPVEEQRGAEPVAVLSHRAWQRSGGDPDTLGSQLVINGTLFRVVGIAPEGFTGTTLVGPDLWLPLGTYGLVGHQGRDEPKDRTIDIWNYPPLSLIGRLKPGVDMAAAEAQLQSIVPRLKETYPRPWRASSTLHLQRLSRVSPDTGPDDRTALSVASGFLMAVSAAVLLIACLNLGNMIVVQGVARHREVAIRMAIGGGRLRIVRQLLCESLLLALIGGALGCVLAYWGTKIISVWLVAPQVPELAGMPPIRLDGRVLAGTLGFCLIATLLFGLKPALRLSGRDVITDIKESGGRVVRSVQRRWRFLPRGLSVVGQIALSVVLVMGAALFTRSALYVARVDPGFALGDKLLIEIDPLAVGYSRVRSVQVYQTLADHFRSMPRIQAVALSASFPFGGGGRHGCMITEYTPGAQDSQIEKPPRPSWKPAYVEYRVGGDFFDVMEIPLLQGRSFGPLDNSPGAEKVVIIDDRLAHKLRPTGSALGCLIQYGYFSFSAPCRVVGIVARVRDGVQENEFPQIYLPIEPDQLPAYVHLRVARGQSQADMLKTVAAEIHRMDPRLPLVSVTTLAQRHRTSPDVWAAGLGARLATTFGIMALFLASLGIYAVKGYMLASRTPEIGIRKALGATHRDIMGMVLREGSVLTAAGLAVGLLLGSGIARLIHSVFYGINPVDPISILVTVALLGTASLLAGYIPARRAAKIDPMEALRYE